MPAFIFLFFYMKQVLHEIRAKIYVFKEHTEEMGRVFFKTIPGQEPRTIEEIQEHQSLKAQLWASHRTEMSKLVESAFIHKHAEDLKKIIEELEGLVEGEICE
jgi:hypothetical protein